MRSLRLSAARPPVMMAYLPPLGRVAWKALPPSSPPWTLLVPTKLVRLELGASESKVMTGMPLAWAASMADATDAGLFGAIARPETFLVIRSRMTRTCSASSTWVPPVNRHSTPIFLASALQPASTSE